MLTLNFHHCDVCIAFAGVCKAISNVNEVIAPALLAKVREVLYYLVYGNYCLVSSFIKFGIISQQFIEGPK